MLLDAALTIVHEEGLAAVGVRSLRAHTKLNPRYLYESFESVDDLLIAALDEVTSEMLRAGVEALHDPRYDAPLDRARHGVTVALGVIFDDPRKATLLGAIGGGPEALQHAYRQRILQVADAILADPEAADQGFDRISALFVSAGIIQISTAYLSGDLDIDRDALADRIARLALGAAAHIGPRPAPRESGG